MLSNWRWRRFLRVPWIARSNQSTLKEINSEYSLEGLALKPKLQYFFHLMQRADSLEKTMMLGKIEGGRRRGRQRMRRLDGISNSSGMSLSELQEMVEDREARYATVCGVAESDTTERLNNILERQTHFGSMRGGVPCQTRRCSRLHSGAGSQWASGAQSCRNTLLLSWSWRQEDSSLH